MSVGAVKRVVRWRALRMPIVGLCLLGATAGLGLAAVSWKAPLNYQTYVGAKGKANPKLKPFVLGWINGQGGTVPGTSFPSTTRIQEAVVKLVNNELGGVDGGHPLKLNECFIVSAEEEGTKCAQQMANDKNVKLIEYGAVVVGNQSIYNVLKGSKPVVMGVSASNADVNAKNVFSMIGTSLSVLSSFGPYVKLAYPNVKTTAVVYPNSPGSDVAAKSIASSMESVGIKATLIAHDPTASDLVGTATQANGYDLINASCNFGDCALLAKGLAQIGSKKPVLTPPLALFIPPVAYPGGHFPAWDVGIAQACLCDPSDPQVKLYAKKATQYGVSAADQTDVFGELAWSTTIEIVKMLNTIPYKTLSGSKSSAAIVAAIKAFKGPLIMGAPVVSCGKIDPTQPAACGNEAQFYRYSVSKSKFERISGFIGPAKKK